MSALRNVATSLSTIIICSIHQPGYGTWEVLDDCILLGKGGCVHYSGSTSDLEEHVRLLGIPSRPYVSTTYRSKLSTWYSSPVFRVGLAY
jgi:hypothetical protein